MHPTPTPPTPESDTLSAPIPLLSARTPFFALCGLFYQIVFLKAEPSIYVRVTHYFLDQTDLQELKSDITENRSLLFCFFFKQQAIKEA